MEKPKLYLFLCLLALLVQGVVIVALAPVSCVKCHKKLTPANSSALVEFCADCADDIAKRLPRRGAVRYVKPYPVDQNDPAVTIVFDTGEVTLELFKTHAPRSVENFLAYARAGRYDGTLVHRLENFLVVAGRYSGHYGVGIPAKLDVIPQLPPIPSEARNGLLNKIGTVALPRTDDNPNSATSDFHVNLLENVHLNWRGDSPQEYGYAVFGQVVSGFDVLEAMSHERTIGDQAPWKGFEKLPRSPIRIHRVVEHPRVPPELVGMAAETAPVGSGGIYGR